MISFELLTPITYWVLICLWGYILWFYFRQHHDLGKTSRAVSILLLVLAVDAFRSLFESVFFGAWYTARVGLLPNYIYEFLVQPEMVIIPKLLNLIVAFLMIALLMKRLIPSIAKEHQNDLELIEKLNVEIAQRKKTEDALKKSEVSLKYEVDVKNQFFSIIAHDLKSPFNYLLGMTSIMASSADKFDKSELVTYANDVNKAGEQFFDLLQNLLEWSRLQMEGVKLEPQMISLRDLAQESIDVLNPMSQDKGIQLKNKIKLDVAFADRQMTATVIRNLINNAVKFTPSGGVIEVSSEVKDHKVQVTVGDTGIGMSKEQIESLFALNKKSSTIGTAGETGTGLGLVLCKDMLERNGGSIWVESTPGKGSLFHFLLPIEPREG